MGDRYCMAICVVERHSNNSQNKQPIIISLWILILFHILEKQLRKLRISRLMTWITIRSLSWALSNAMSAKKISNFTTRPGKDGLKGLNYHRFCKVSLLEGIPNPKRENHWAIANKYSWSIFFIIPIKFYAFCSKFIKFTNHPPFPNPYSLRLQYTRRSHYRTKWLFG